jgi:hypothetical protein
MRYFFISSTLLALCLAFLLTSCELLEEASKPKSLPSKTSEGLNTFGCMVDNNLWVPWLKPLFIRINPVDKLSARGQSSEFYISVKHDDHRKLERIRIQVNLDTNEQVIPDRTYEFAGVGLTEDPATNYYQTHASGSATNRECYFGGDDLYSEGWIRFYRYDLPTRDSTGVAAGEFEFTMQGNSEECGERVVTKGRFDVELRW